VNTGTLDAPPYVLAVTPVVVSEIFPVVLPYAIPLIPSSDALALAVVKYRLVPSATLDVVNTPDDVMAAANCAFETVPAAPPTEVTPPVTVIIPVVLSYVPEPVTEIDALDLALVK
jgi:hypothetical protein